MSRDHYISQFHLRAFTDPCTPPMHEPSLWVGDIACGTIERKSPKNVAWEANLYSGHVYDEARSYEQWLSQAESRAAPALKKLSCAPRGAKGMELVADLSRYLALAAAKTKAMRTLLEEWINNLPDGPVVEPPPAWFTKMSETISGSIGLRDPVGNTRSVGSIDEARGLVGEGWKIVLDGPGFRALVYGLARYFDERLFPKLTWSVLWAPVGRAFVLSDRPVCWHAGGYTNVMPSALRSEECALIAPLSPRVALFADHNKKAVPELVHIDYANLLSVGSSERFIYGSSWEAVSESLALLYKKGVGH